MKFMFVFLAFFVILSATTTIFASSVTSCILTHRCQNYIKRSMGLRSLDVRPISTFAHISTLSSLLARPFSNFPWADPSPLSKQMMPRLNDTWPVIEQKTDELAKQLEQLLHEYKELTQKIIGYPCFLSAAKNIDFTKDCVEKFEFVKFQKDYLLLFFDWKNLYDKKDNYHLNEKNRMILTIANIIPTKAIAQIKGINTESNDNMLYQTAQKIHIPRLQLLFPNYRIFSDVNDIIEDNIKLQSKKERRLNDDIRLARSLEKTQSDLDKWSLNFYRGALIQGLFPNPAILKKVDYLKFVLDKIERDASIDSQKGE